MQIPWFQKVLAQIGVYTDKDLETIFELMPEKKLQPYEGEVLLTRDLQAFHLFMMRRRKKLRWIASKAPGGYMKTERGMRRYTRLYYSTKVLEEFFWETVVATFAQIPTQHELEVTREYRIVWRKRPEAQQYHPGYVAIYLGTEGDDVDDASDLADFPVDGSLPN